MKKIIFIGLFVLGFTQIFAQKQSDSIINKKEGASYHGIDELTPKQLLDITKSNPEANKQMNIADNYYFMRELSRDLGNAELIVGVIICLGDYKKGMGLSPSKTNYLKVSTSVWGGLYIISLLPLTIECNRHAKKAIRIYNRGLTQTGMNKVDFRFGMTNNGIGINVMF